MLYCQTVFIAALSVVSTLSFSQKYQGDSWTQVKSNGSGVLAIVYSEQFGLISKDKDGNMKGKADSTDVKMKGDDMKRKMDDGRTKSKND